MVSFFYLRTETFYIWSTMIATLADCAALAYGSCQNFPKRG